MKSVGNEGKSEIMHCICLSYEVSDDQIANVAAITNSNGIER